MAIPPVAGGGSVYEPPQSKYNVLEQLSEDLAQYFDNPNETSYAQLQTEINNLLNTPNLSGKDKQVITAIQDIMQGVHNKVENLWAEIQQTQDPGKKEQLVQEYITLLRQVQQEIQAAVKGS